MKPVEAPINWTLWTADDLKKASQRKHFDIPLRAGGKVQTKKQLVTAYSAALEEVASAA